MVIPTRPCRSASHETVLGPGLIPENCFSNSRISETGNSRLRLNSRAFHAMSRWASKISMSNNRDPGSENFQECGQPRRVRGPGGGRHQVSVDVRLINADLDVISAGQPDFRTARRVCRAAPARQDPRRGQNLQAVADGGDRFSRGVELPNDIEDALVEAQILGRPAARNE